MGTRTKPSRIGRFHFDVLLVLASVGLLLIGYVMVVSSTIHIGSKVLEETIWNFPLKQLIHIVFGIVLGSFIATVPMEKWEKSGSLLYLAGLVLLLAVLIPGLGKEVNGSTRWLELPGLRIQVSEIAKFFAVVYMAGYVMRQQKSIRESAFGLLRPMLPFSLVAVLLLLEPDFGSTVVILMIVMGLMFLAGARLKQFGLLIVALAIPITSLVIFAPYRMERLTSFANPWADPLDSGLQLTQALIAFGRGGWFGVGLGNGLQKLSYLPEAHTDFIFSVIAEELGLFGVMSVIAMFGLFVGRAFVIGAKAEKAGLLFPAYLAYGLGIWFGFQAFVHMGVNMGLLPTKGLTLPLMSYGGGSMMVMCCAVGLLFRVHSETAETNASTIRPPRVVVAAARVKQHA